MSEFFDLTHDARSGIAELVLNPRAIRAWRDKRPGGRAPLWPAAKV